MRTFVFISNIPDFLLNLSKEEKNNFRKNQQPLRKLLVSHSSGVMLVTNLVDRGYGLALYASEEEAIAACKETILPEGASFPLRLRILEKEKPLLPEAVYSPTILIEGEAMEKSTLATTRGLELAYRGKAVPKWCPQTLQHQDCNFGISCLKIHRAGVQRTERKRPRELMDDHMSEEETVMVARVLAQAQVDEGVYDHLVPPSLRLRRVQEKKSHLPLIPVSEAELEKWLLTTEFRGESGASVEASLIHRMEEAFKESGIGSSSMDTTKYFFRLTCPGGSPWDWALCDEEVGLPALRQRCQLPANGAPTPLERDEVIQKLWFWLNQLNGFTDVGNGIRAIRRSDKVRDAIRFRHKHSVAEGSSFQQVFLKAIPWVYLPTVTAECSMYIQAVGTGAVRGLTQRRGQLRIMTSARLIQTLLTTTGNEKNKEEEAGLIEALNTILSRIAVEHRGADPEAEKLLEEELKDYEKRFLAAAETMREHLQHTMTSHNTSTPAMEALLPSSAALTVQLAMRPEVDGDGLKSIGKAVRYAPVVLSLDTYERGLEKCALSNRLVMPSSEERRDGERKIRQVEWNTTRHWYEPLFTREVLLRLRAPEREGN